MNFLEIQFYYKDLSLKLREDSFRESLGEGELCKSVLCLEELFEKSWKEHEIIENNAISSTEAVFRFLRNSCVACERNQNIITKKTAAVSLTLNILHKTLEQNHWKEETKSIKSLQIVLIQFLGNLVTGNAYCQAVVWNEILPKFAKFFLENLESPNNDLFCMVIFNCIRNRTNVIHENGFVDLVVLIAELCKKNHAEWSLFIMEDIIARENFMDLYIKMDEFHKQRLVILDLLLAFLEDEKLDIPERALLCLSDMFEGSLKLSTCGMTNDCGTSSLQNVELLLRYLKILCAATVYRCKYENLLKKPGLLEHAVCLLKTISENTDPALTQRNVETNKESSLSGFKRYLVRIIGNMCYENNMNQNQVREFGGLPVILENCKIDDDNPYLCQWAIFAVRNLCKENLENQKFISKMEIQGLVDNEALRRQGIEARLENGKIRVRMGGSDI